MNHLSKVIAVEKDAKDKAAQALSHAQGILGNNKLLIGIARSYTPKDDEGEQLPPESTRVQVKVPQVLKAMQKQFAALFDIIATKDWTNCQARADIVLDDGKVLLREVPATHLLFLEKQLAELLSFAKKIPALDASESWEYDKAQDCYATPPTETIRTKKEQQFRVVVQATDHHPAQVHGWQEDIHVGRWRTVHYSGAIPASDLNAMVERIERVQRAVKYAREEANRHEAIQQHVGETILHYIFG